jgi:hypothetical protein
MSFEELVRAIRDALGRRTPILHAPPAAMAALARALGFSYATSSSPPTRFVA